MLIFLDAEMTGLEDEDRICSLGVIYTLGENTRYDYSLINDGRKITAKASSINHITNEMLGDQPILQNSSVYKFLESNNNEETTIIGHNIQYITKQLSAIGYNFKGTLIDTLRVSKHLIKECKSYSLQFLRYELKLYKIEELEVKKIGVNMPIVAHHALGDSLVVRSLYFYLLELATHNEMCRLSFENVLLVKFEFGKYKEHYIEEICLDDRNYIEWMLSNMDLDDDLRYSIDYYLKDVF